MAGPHQPELYGMGESYARGIRTWHFLQRILSHFFQMTPSLLPQTTVRFLSMKPRHLFQMAFRYLLRMVPRLLFQMAFRYLLRMVPRLLFQMAPRRQLQVTPSPLLQTPIRLLLRTNPRHITMISPTHLLHGGLMISKRLSAFSLLLQRIYPLMRFRCSLLLGIAPKDLDMSCSLLWIMPFQRPSASS